MGYTRPTAAAAQAMTNSFAFTLFFVLVTLAAADLVFLGGDTLVFLARRLVSLVIHLTFWR